MKIYDRDETTKVEVGLNSDGELYLCNETSGYNMADTPGNRRYVARDFFRYTDRPVTDSFCNDYDYYASGDYKRETDAIYHQMAVDTADIGEVWEEN